MYRIVSITVYMFCLVIAMYATSSIQFEKFCNTRSLRKVQLLWIILSICFAYLSGQFLLILINYK